MDIVLLTSAIRQMGCYYHVNSHSIYYFRKMNFSNKTIVLFIILILILPAMMVAQTSYYISSSEGNDTNNGTSASQPWKSLTKVNSFKPNPGDQILFKRGDAWEGSLILSASGTSGSPVIYGAYGTGDKPKIFGSTEITGWTLHSGNIYKATVSSAVSQLFVDGKKVQVSKVPNTGYYYPTSIGSTTQFTSASLNGGIDYTGASCLYKGYFYRFSLLTVTSSVGQTINLSAAPSGGMATIEGFVLMNHVNLIDQAGEWAYDSGTGTVYAWLPDSSDPSLHTITGSTETYGIYIYHADYVDVENLEIRNASGAGLRINHAKYICVKNCDLINNAAYGIQIGGGTQSNLIIENNIVTNSGDYGIQNASHNSVITNNKVADIGLLDEVGIASKAIGTGISTKGTGSTVTYNSIENTGYNGITFDGQNTTVSYNFIDSTNLVLDDGGGIYTYVGTLGDVGSQNSIVSYNIVLNSHGNRAGGGASYDGGCGIYIDGYSHDITIDHNTVAHSTTGILINTTNTGNTVVNNTIMDAGMLLSVGGTVGSIISNNIVYATERLVDYVWWQDGTQRLASTAGVSHTFDYNKYIHPYSTINLFKKGASHFNFAGWQTDTGYDANSTFDGTPLGAGEVEELFYNDTKQAKVFDLGSVIGAYRDLDGNPVSGELSLNPFTSKILIKTDVASTTNQQRKGASGILVYPNPTNGEFTVQANDLPSDICSISLYKITGEKVLEQQFSSSSNTLEETFHLSGLSKGIYLLRMVCGSTIYQSKVVINGNK